MSGTSSITGPITRDNSGMMAVSQRHVRSIHLRFKDTPGDVELRTHLFRDEIVLRDQTLASGPESVAQKDLSEHLQQLAERAGVTLKPEDIRFSRQEHTVFPKPDLSKPTPLETIASYNRDRRDYPNGATPVYVGEVHLPVSSAPTYLAQIVDTRPEVLRYVEILEKDDGEFNWYTAEGDNPNFDIYRFFQQQQSDATQGAIAATQAAEAKARLESELQKTRDMAQNAADKKAGTIESQESDVKIDGVKIPRKTQP